VVVLDNDRAACDNAQSDLPNLSATLLADVSDHDAVEKAFQDLDDIFQGLDIFINNAGISLRHAFLDVSPDEWERVISVNLTDVFYVAQQAAQRMIKAGTGVIINMGSTNGLLGYPNYSDYNSSKA